MSDIYKEFYNKVKHNLTKNEISILESKNISKASIKPGYYSKAKPVYRMYFEQLKDNIESIKWNDKNGFRVWEKEKYNGSH